MTTIKTLTGESIPKGTRGLLYLCDYDYNKRTLTPKKAKFFKEPYFALEAYANTPNPPSHVITGETLEEFEKNLKREHFWMTNPDYQYDLFNYL